MSQIFKATDLLIEPMCGLNIKPISDQIGQNQHILLVKNVTSHQGRWLTKVVEDQECGQLGPGND